MQREANGIEHSAPANPCCHRMAISRIPEKWRYRRLTVENIDGHKGLPTRVMLMTPALSLHAVQSRLLLHPIFV
jgi:hypothetical protein